MNPFFVPFIAFLILMAFPLPSFTGVGIIGVWWLYTMIKS
jgi:hypothetical protein